MNSWGGVKEKRSSVQTGLSAFCLAGGVPKGGPGEDVGLWPTHCETLQTMGSVSRSPQADISNFVSRA
jgi:hypothetical protein